MESFGNNNRRKDKSDFTVHHRDGSPNETIGNVDNTDKPRHTERSAETKKISCASVGKQLRLLAIKVILKLVRK